MKRTFRAVVAIALLTLLGACSHTADRGEVHPARKTVVFEGIEFKVNSREYRYSLNASGKTVVPEGVFVVIEVSLKNGYSMPVPAQFQPRFTLVDSAGREHMPQKEGSSTQKGASTTELAPQTSYAKRLVFDVPEAEYKLRVFTPIIVKSGPEGSIQGRYFYYDLKPGH